MKKSPKKCGPGKGTEVKMRSVGIYSGKIIAENLSNTEKEMDTRMSEAFTTATHMNREHLSVAQGEKLFKL